MSYSYSMKSLLLCVCLVTQSVGYQFYQEKIPNGDHIPHPCKINYLWKGVGHVSDAGAGERNSFGKDFKEAGYKWTKSLCEKDSDGDGKSNGEELGDPHCSWEEGAAPNKTKGLTHPAVCEPFNDAECKKNNKWVNCELEKFECPAVEEEGVMKTELRFPLTKVPAKETTYICLSFDLPSDGDYHMIATTPIINNTAVMHHLLVYGCEENSTVITSPEECNMGGCNALIGLWTVGSPGTCLYEEIGFRIGQMGIKKAMMQFHWTNPEEKDDLYDASGITLYYTKKLRKYNAGTFSTGQVHLEIPPLTRRVIQQSVCEPKCTQRNFNGSVYLVAGTNHMHYLGVGGSVKLHRPDGTTTMLTHDDPYSYDNPVSHKYASPIEVRPGDALETVCTYRSVSRKTRTEFGDGTFEEMCFTFFTYYPAEAIKPSAQTCYETKDIDICDFQDRKCNPGSVFNLMIPRSKALVDKVLGACDYKGECFHGCRKVLDEVIKDEPCYHDDLREMILTNFISRIERLGNDALTLYVMKFASAFRSCQLNKEYPIEYVPYSYPVEQVVIDDVNSGWIFGSSVVLIICNIMLQYFLN